MQLSIFQLLAYRMVYNHPMDAFLLHWVRSCQFPGPWPIKRFTTIQECVSSALSMHMSVYRLLAYRMVYNLPRDAFLLHWICNCRYGLQSCKGCVSSVLSMQLPVSRLAYRTVYNHSKDAFLRHWICNCRYKFQSSKGYVSSALSKQLSVSQSLDYRTVYNYPKDAFLLQ